MGTGSEIRAKHRFDVYSDEGGVLDKLGSFKSIVVIQIWISYNAVRNISV